MSFSRMAQSPVFYSIAFSSTRRKEENSDTSTYKSLRFR